MRHNSTSPSNLICGWVPIPSNSDGATLIVESMRIVGGVPVVNEELQSLTQTPYKLEVILTSGILRIIEATTYSVDSSAYPPHPWFHFALSLVSILALIYIARYAARASQCRIWAAKITTRRLSEDYSQLWDMSYLRIRTVWATTSSLKCHLFGNLCRDIVPGPP